MILRKSLLASSIALLSAHAAADITHSTFALAGGDPLTLSDNKLEF